MQHHWQAYDRKLDNILSINKDIAVQLARQKLNQQIGRLYRPKGMAVFIGLPYTLLLLVVASITFLAEAYFMALGFGGIALLMVIVLSLYFYQIYLISRIKRADEILRTQQLLAQLRLASFRSLTLSVFQLPLWSVCWISINGLQHDPLVYGGVNLLIFLGLSYLAYWLHQRLSYKHKDSRVRDFFLSGSEWEPLQRSTEILQQIKAYKRGAI